MILQYSERRRPMTWRRLGVWIQVTCSLGHTSHVRHIVQPDGTLVAPVGHSPSLHCGWCNEELPLKLEGWKP